MLHEDQNVVDEGTCTAHILLPYLLLNPKMLHTSQSLYFYLLCPDRRNSKFPQHLQNKLYHLKNLGLLLCGRT